jgi:hypothetical protein
MVKSVDKRSTLSSDVPANKDSTYDLEVFTRWHMEYKVFLFIDRPMVEAGVAQSV